MKVDGKRAYERARAGEEVVLDARPVTVYRFEQLWREDDRAALRSTARPARTCARSSPTSATRLPAAAAHRDRAVLDRRRRPGAARLAADALSFMPSCASTATTPARRARVAVAGASRRRAPRAVLLVDADGPIAVAEPRDGALKPVVGFRA